MRNSDSGEVLLLHEDSLWRRELAEFLKAGGHEVIAVSREADALAHLVKGAISVVLVGLEPPSRQEGRLLRQLRACAPKAELVLLSTQPTVDSLMEALRLGVRDYLRMPDDLNRLMHVVGVAVAEVHAERNEAVPPSLAPLMNTANQISAANLAEARPSESLVRVQELAAATPLESGENVLLGDSAIMQFVRQQILELAPYCITVLVQEETGTGKDIVARLLHANSPRAKSGEFFKINCPSVPESLFESEMFGYEEGAFTGAQRQRLGRFELAHKGTIFLDEIGLLPLSMQAKLLEVLEYKSFFRVGGQAKVEVDTRVVAATNAPLEHMVAAGLFRQDLFYRLQVAVVALPPLRDRLEDLPILMGYMLQQYAAKYTLPVRTVSEDAMNTLLSYPWPGNVRELSGILGRFAVQNDPSIFERLDMKLVDTSAPAQRTTLESVEVQEIRAALQRVGWNQRKAAELLGIGYHALRRRLRKYGIERPSASNWVTPALSNDEDVSVGNRLRPPIQPEEIPQVPGVLYSPVPRPYPEFVPDGITTPADLTPGMFS